MIKTGGFQKDFPARNIRNLLINIVEKATRKKEKRFMRVNH
jgi:hypothetical protein